MYTPGFVYNGKEWRAWFSDKSVTFPPGEQPGVLEVVVSESTASVRFVPTASDVSNYHAHVALLGFDLSTPVRAGENRGRTLRHDFVVLGMQEQQLARQNTALTGELAVPTASVSAPEYGLVVWVTRDSRQMPVQAVGGWLPR